MEANLVYFSSFKSHEIRFERKSRTPRVSMPCQLIRGIDADFAEPVVSVALLILFMVSNHACASLSRIRGVGLGATGILT
jgi:hypothetical protein